ncbi:hypothetical protein HS125_18740 [bacterium]|nr:hypothetical protein [bacterium]
MRISIKSSRAVRWTLGAGVILGVAAAAVLCQGLARTPVDVGVDLAVLPSEAPWLSGQRFGPLEMRRIPERFVSHRVSFTLVALGSRNPAAAASEVKIFNLPERGEIEVEPPGSWRNLGKGLWVSHRVQPATLTWSGPASRLRVLQLVHNPWSGHARLTTSTGEIELDLYAPEERKGIVDYAHPAGEPPARYHGRVPRRAASALSLRTGPGAEIARIYVGGWWPRAYEGTAARRSAPGVWSLPSLPAWQRGGWVTFVPACFAFTLLTYCALRLFVRLWRAAAQPLPDFALAPFPRRMFFAFFGALMLEYVVAWLALFPAAMTEDSLWTWDMTRMMKWNDNHPAWHAMTLAFCTRLWDSPGSIVPAQMLLFAGVQAYGFCLLVRAGVRRAVVLSAFALSLLSLRNALVVATVWKDVWFTALLAFAILVSLQLLLCARSRRRMWLWIALGLAMGFLPLYRHNGLVLLAVYPLLLLLVFRREWRRVAVASALALAVLGVVKVGVYRHYQVAPMDSRTWGLFYSWQIAALLDQPVVLAPEEYELLDGARPFGEGAWDYRPERPMSTIYHPLHGYKYIAAHEGEYFALYRALLLRYPLVFAWQRPATTAYLWWPGVYRSPMLSGGSFATNIRENHFGLESRPVLPWVQKGLAFLAQGSYRAPLLHDLWRPAWHLWAITLAAIVLMRRTGRGEWLLLYGPLWINTLVIVLFTHSPEARYQLPVTFMAGMLVALGWLPWGEGRAEARRGERIARAEARRGERIARAEAQRAQREG